jgi:hypothetical protein
MTLRSLISTSSGRNRIEGSKQAAGRRKKKKRARL